MSSCATLLVDNSNTRTKFALLAPGAGLLPEVRSCATADISAATLRRTLRGWSFERAIVCSVAPAAAAILRQELGCPLHEITAASCPELLRGYPAPESLGADRIANAAAVAALYPLPCIAVDLGTACTFDLVVAEADGPRFVGGVIAPGLLTSAKALAAQTAKLPLITPEEMRATPQPVAIGRNTREAMCAGLLHGYRGMLQNILAEMRRSVAQRCCVVLTGGDATLWPQCPDWADHIDNTLTLKGIIEITRNQSAFF